MKNKKQGFTLIELLVVVLIIGILSAIALPQYQKAVEKAKATQALALLKSISQATTVYYLNNGTCPNSFDELEIIPPTEWNGNTAWTENWNGNIRDTRSNKDWSFQLFGSHDNGEISLYAGRISGDYKGAGFGISISLGTLNDKPVQTILCMERKNTGIAYTKNVGDYCVKLFNGKQILNASSVRMYEVP